MRSSEESASTDTPIVIDLTSSLLQRQSHDIPQTRKSQNLLRGSVLLIFIVSILFNAYICFRYFARDWHTWEGASFFGKTALGAITICIHWVGGFLVNICGCIQMLPEIRHKYPAVHRASGRMYLFGAFLASIGGFIYIIAMGTVGGLQMDTAFGIYGVLIFICCCQVIYHIRKPVPDIVQHSNWAIRLFMLGIGSALYRVYVLPLLMGYFVDHAITYLNICGWLMFVPNIFIAEIIIRFRNTSSIK